MYMKKSLKKIIKRIYKKMDLLKDLKMSLLNLSFVTIYIIHQMLVLLKNHLNYLKDIFESLFKEYKRLFNFFKRINFFHNI